MSDLGFNVWGALASAAGILFALYPAFKAWVRPRLPTSLLPGILAMYKETQELFAIAIQNGLIDDPDELYLCNLNMVAISIRVDEVRAKVYAITSWRQDVGQWWSGLSEKIGMLSKALNDFRKDLAERNSSKLKLLASQGLLLGERAFMSQDSKCSASDNNDVPTTPPRPPQEYYHRAVGVRYGVHSDNHPQPDERDSTLLAGAKGQDGSSGLSAHDVPTVSADQGFHVSIADPTQQLISKADLAGLLELALSGSHHCPHRSKSCRSGKDRKDLFLHSCKHGRGRTTRRSPVASGSRSSKRDALHARLQGLERLVRRLYGLRARSRMADMSGKGEVVLDPESLTPLGVNGNDSDTDGDSDEWEEECQ